VSPLISQTVTTINKDTVICLPLSVSKQIILDLESGDLCSEELDLIKEDTVNLNKKIYYLSDAISLMEKKEESYVKSIKNYQQVDSLNTNKINTLESKLTNANTTRNILAGTSVGLLLITLLLIL
jgi:hypothetical protein